MPAGNSGMDLRDLLHDHDFKARKPRAHAPDAQAKAFLRLARVFVENPRIVLQELVNLAVSTCGADSAGISLEDPHFGRQKFRWIAVAGSFAHFINGTTPRFFSPCGTTLDRGRPQLYSVAKAYYDFLGIEALPINDGILIPWFAEDMRGTIWAVSHGSSETFDYADYTTLQGLADFAAIAVRQHDQHEALRERDKLAAFGEAAHSLAHDINNPLQSLTNMLYLAQQPQVDARLMIMQASAELDRISDLVRKILTRDPIKDEAAEAKLPPQSETAAD